MQLPGAWPSLKGLFAALLLVADVSQAIPLDLQSPQSIKAAASQVTWNMMTYYHGNESGQIPGAFPSKWWEGSALFMALLNYWHFTGDSTYNAELSQGLEWQAGPDDYMPSNYSQYLGNDDQMFWGLAAMTATEFKLPDIPGKYSWLSLAQGVFNNQITRWDPTTCNGGMRWQIYIYQAGYTMKNSVSNGGLFQLSARLARYTHNEGYANWARKIWDWSVQSLLIDNSTWNIGDSVSIDNNCATLGNIQWTYNYGIYLMGAAYMYNYTNGTEQQYWLTAVNGILHATLANFFKPEHNYIMEDWECEPQENCNNNDVLFKGLLSTWLGYTALIVPSTYDTIMPKLQSSAQGAAASCAGPNNDCGVRWYQSQWDGKIGMEEEISVSNVLSVNLIPFENRVLKAPLTSFTGGNSSSNPNAGMNHPTGMQQAPITTGDKAGAGILTALFVGGWIALISWMILGH